MDKVEITQEQADIIENTKKALTGFSDALLLDVFSGNYEIKPEFKVGDWVVHKQLGWIGDISKVKVSEITINVTLKNRYIASISNIRHATPSEIEEEKERRWWGKHGREVRMYKKGDIVINLSREDGLDREPFEMDRDLTTEGSHLRLVCAVEDRLDMKINE